ncbi:MAG: hypothetical protein ACTSPQ_19715 [Candidatus Helarchaeota archaeon]
MGNYGKEGDLREIDRLLKIFITDKKSNWIYEYFIFRLILAISYGIIVIDLNFVNIYPFYLLLFILLLWNLKNILKRFIFNKKIRENIEKFSIRLDDLVTFCLLCFYGLFYLIPLIDIAINGIFFCYIIIWLFSFIIHVIIIPLLVDRPILPIKMKTNKR